MILRASLIVVIVTLGLPMAAMCAPKTKTPSIEARLEALENQNAALSDQVARLQKLLTQTRMDLAQAMGGPVVGVAAGAYINPPTFQSQNSAQAISSDPVVQNQINQNIIQQQALQTQLGNQQLQQSIQQDRFHEQQMINMAPQPVFPPPR
jgi:hypothetical protein